MNKIFDTTQKELDQEVENQNRRYHQAQSSS